MKVAYLTGSLNRGGAETLLLDIFRKSGSAPFDMILICRKGGLYENDFKKEKPHSYRIAPRGWHFCSYLRQLRKTIIEEQVTMIHAFYWLDAIYAKLATIGLNIPIVITFHGYEGTNANWLKGVRYRMVMRVAKKVCFVSEVQMKSFVSRYGSIVTGKGVVLYNGLNFDKFDAIESRAESQESRVKLCMVGNFNSVRSQKVIVKALQLLTNYPPHITHHPSPITTLSLFDFYFIGGRYKGEEYYYDECVAYCDKNGMDNVHFMGVRDDVPALLKSMDGFVYSTNHDTFGIAVVEAIAAALPVVLNDHPVMQEICGAPNAGVRYFRTNDAHDAAAQIADMIANMQLCKQAAKMNAAVIREKYSILTHIDNAYQIYSSL